MKTFMKSMHSLKSSFRAQAVLSCLIIAAVSLATLPARAADAEADAQKAFDNWKAASEAVEKAKENLKKARAKRDKLMAASTGGGKLTDAQQTQLANAREEVAKAEAALEAAEAALLAARIALEKAIAELPEDSKVKKELKRQRDAITGQAQLTELSPQTQQIVQTKTAGGLQVTTFDISYGRVVVNLPNDIMAGDTISGTVVTEPKGNTPEEKTKNKAVLDGVVLDLGGTKLPANKPSFTWLPPAPLPSGEPVRYQLRIVEILGRQTPYDAMTNGGAVITPYPKVTQPRVITPDPKITPSFIIPHLGQTGRPIVITGPFDGNSSNTKIDSQPPTGGDRNGLNILAESPRQVVVNTPPNITGPMQIRVNDNGAETTGNFRNIGVNLSAPKTSLRKGESTTLKIEVSGLQGITEPVPLHLVKGGVVTMQGGDVQSMTIKPAEVQSNGTFTTTRTITGVQTGVWNATATVVVFDTCLQDDNSGDLVVYSSVTGDFIFCQGRRNLAGANPTSLSTLNFGGTDFTGGVRVAAGDVNDSGGSGAGLVSIGPGASMYKNGAVTVADFNYKPGYIHVQIDPFNHTGNAIVQTTKPKQEFTITDRDTRNNTCTCN